MRELTEGIAAVIDDTKRLNSMLQTAYEKCNAGFDWSDRGRTLYDGIQQAVDRQRSACARKSGP
jgi:hypothetical protein